MKNAKWLFQGRWRWRTTEATRRDKGLGLVSSVAAEIKTDTVHCKRFSGCCCFCWCFLVLLLSCPLLRHITFAARLAGKEPPERRQELMNNRRRQSKATSGGQIYVGTEEEEGVEGATHRKLINSNYQLAKSHPPPPPSL